MTQHPLTDFFLNARAPRVNRGSPRGKLCTNARVTVASLNIRGSGSANTLPKWQMVASLMRKKHIGVLVVEETHLSPAAMRDLNRQFYKSIYIVNSTDMLSPNSKGIAIVINKKLAYFRQEDLNTEVIEAGRALKISIPWRNGSSALNILGVYAPNNPQDSERFWAHLSGHFANLPRDDCPHFVLGDFNLVEDSLDRSPAHLDDNRAVDALHDFKQQLGLARNHPLSRIDRIYLRHDMYHATPTYYNLNMPHIGKRRWQIPSFLLEHEDFLKEVDSLCKTAAAEIQSAGAARFPQSIFQTLKNDIRQKARERTRDMIPKAVKEINHLSIECDRILNDETLPEHDRTIRATELEVKICQLEAIRHERARDDTRALNILENKTIRKYWIKANTKRPPRDIYMLKDPNHPDDPPAKRSKDMSRMMHDYHEQLQSDEDQSEEFRRLASEEVLGEIDTSLSLEAREKLDSYLDREIVLEALLSMPMRKHKEASELNDEEHPADIIGILLSVFNSVEEYGVSDTYNFAKGWLCPLYKKKDRNNPANYRPITVLDADYKTYTKALSLRLASVAPEIIHPDQAGFMAGRRIDDQTELIKLMNKWCKVEEENGLLVFLDQEKAYDRIRHDFLFESMEKYGLPPKFIMAHLLQRHESVRQGDPLSCLLFNIAIESLANLLRKSPLKGFSLPEQAERLIVSLFADDTTIYLSENDNFKDLQAILDCWCCASGAKFNVDKTETIPIGPLQYWDRVRTTRLIQDNNQDSLIPGNIRVAEEGTAVRALGAFVGNGVDNANVWTPTLETMECKVSHWLRSDPSFEGHSYLTKLELGGRTQYRTMVQGMLAEVEK
ncbi:hypothetical protein NMY22_g15863 [Coprinellus aureogranulatus]|nr:hypothetical protein NMY22_g15863 [Coprinellus aureogranulatus]